jgi:hypothetical protein
MVKQLANRPERKLALQLRTAGPQHTEPLVAGFLHRRIQQPALPGARSPLDHHQPSTTGPNRRDRGT